MTAYIIEGIDRCSKSTLVQAIQHEAGFHQVIHYSKPQQLAIYNKRLGNPLRQYQYDSFMTGFELLKVKQASLIYDRFHLGETVYSPRYRGYSGDYVFNLEKINGVDNWNHVRLILLTTSDFSIMEDDGDSFDWSAKEAEQLDFLVAFAKSTFMHKLVINVADGNGNYKPVEQILNEVLTWQKMT